VPPTAHPDTSPSDAWQLRLADFDRAWQQRFAAAPPPLWWDFLPPVGEFCPPEFVVRLLTADVERRAEAGLPALLSEGYLDDDRLRRAGIALGPEVVADLVRREYRLRWQNGQRPGRQEYLERFPALSEALRDLRPSAPCPRCGRHEVTLADEGSEVATCPACGSTLPRDELFPAQPSPATVSTPAVPATASLGLPDNTEMAGASAGALRRLGRYEVVEEIARGGMGAVLRVRDPELRAYPNNPCWSITAGCSCS
jgi:hypothetical protein